MSRPYLVVLLLSLLYLLGGCGSDNAGAGSVPNPAGSDAAARQWSGCPSLTTTPGHGVAVDYVDFVHANGMSYQVAEQMNLPAVPVAVSDIGAEQFRVRCSLSKLNDQTHVFPPPPRDGDASFLPAGTPLHAIRGWSPTCRLAAQLAGRWQVYLAVDEHSSPAKPQPCAVAHH